MTVHFRLGQYARHDRNVWYSPCGTRVTDARAIAQLEAEYRKVQAEFSNGHRPARGKLPAQIRAERQHHRTPREKRANGRPEVNE